MLPFGKQNRRAAALRKEWQLLCREEAALRAAAQKPAPGWKTTLEQKLPPKAAQGLRAAFARAFGLVFEKGVPLIEKSYDRQTLQQDQAIRSYAVQLKGGRRELRAVRKGAGTGLADLALTAAEGIGLGALGVGLPDIVLFLGVLLRGVYRTALQYGFAYETPAEQQLILIMLEASLSREEAVCQADAAVDALLAQEPPAEPEPGQLEQQTRSTADAFAVELLVLKFVQGLPVAGILGGAGNPVYYRRVLRYVQLKYRKRWLLHTARSFGVELPAAKPGTRTT